MKSGEIKIFITYNQTVLNFEELTTIILHFVLYDHKT